MTSPLTDKAVEAGARAAALNAFEKCRPVERVVCQDFGMQQRDILSQQLDAAIDAYRAALAAEGLCMVPREPTQAMLDAVVAFPTALVAERNDPHYTAQMQAATTAERLLAAQRYRAMIEAAGNPAAEPTEG